MNLILTVPVDVDFSKVAQEPCVSGVRLNTTYTGSGHQTIEQILLSMRRKAGGKDVWVDLKARQPRIAAYNVEFLKDSELHRITLTHSFKLDTKKKAWQPSCRIIS